MVLRQTGRRTRTGMGCDVQEVGQIRRGQAVNGLDCVAAGFEITESINVS